MSPTTELGAAALLWVLLHKLVAGSSLRFWLVARLGEGPYRGVFALLSILSLTFLITSYRAAPPEILWITPAPLYALPIAVVPISYFLLAGAFSVKNPTAVGGESALEGKPPVKGVLRITRHPFLWGVAVWAAAHLIVNGDIASLLLFGSLLLTALLGTRDIDQKRAQQSPEAWRAYAEATSNLPFLALVRGRTRLVLAELWIPAVGALVLTALTLAFHQRLFHVSPLP